MKLITPKGPVLIHEDYDPVKAHEYYLRNRELKGRPTATAKPLLGSRTAAVKTAPVAKRSGTQIARKPILNKKPGMDVAQAKARVAAIQKRLGALENVLKDLTKQKAAADAKSKVKKAAKKTATPKAAPKRQLTAKQKSDNRKRAKEYYEDHKQPTAAKTATKKSAKPKEPSHDEKISMVKEQIKKTKVELSVAKVKAGIK